MKFRLYHKNGKTKIFESKSLDEAEKKANKIWKDWSDLKILKYCKERKSPVLNKRQYVKKSDKIYDRKKDKEKIKKEIEQDNL
jgi:hypothetical protein